MRERQKSRCLALFQVFVFLSIPYGSVSWVAGSSCLSGFNICMGEFKKEMMCRKHLWYVCAWHLGRSRSMSALFVRRFYGWPHQLGLLGWVCHKLRNQSRVSRMPCQQLRKTQVWILALYLPPRILLSLSVFICQWKECLSQRAAEMTKKNMDKW